MTYRTAIASFLLATLLAACSGSVTSLTTGSLFGGSDAKEEKAAPAAAPTGDSTSRAFQVGSVSARAMKCGFNFDAPGLKTKFLTAEAAKGASADMISRADKIYDVAYNGVWKGVAEQKSYCSPKRTEQIRNDLRRHLAGDYTPRASKAAVVEEKKESGFFTSWF
ncbi:MAG: hypothetical protein K0U34_08675 [Alphaproteobacteria bacterium]|nr:hypothetical protein [Alphaproteobacteria bacterium]